MGNSLALPDAEATLAKQEEIQAAVFSELCSSLGVSEISPQDLLRSQSFRQSLGNPSDDAVHKLVESMGRGVSCSPIASDVFAKVVRAWNVFAVVDSATEGELEAKELHNLLYFQNRKLVADKDSKDFLGQLTLNSQGRITRTAWIEAALRV